MFTRISTRAALCAGLLALTMLAACGRDPAPPLAPDEPAVLQDYVAIAEQTADVLDAHPTDRAAAGDALAALYTEHEAAWSKTVTRMRALYTADIKRDLGDRMPNRHAKLLGRLEAASKRQSAHVAGAPWVLRDEKARDILAKLAIADEYENYIRENWSQTGPEDE
ncbi:MAG: hypothetical protein EP329_05125 [Deltaproteobacteria bacterium]|nr:MAG: hypothetical protein EP329_05125 [Deltaproteobacteria bacterium]